MKSVEALLVLVEREGPALLAAAARALRLDTAAWLALVSGPADEPAQAFFASRSYAAIHEMRMTCPFCGERPVAAVLRPEGEGGRRHLLCSLCFTEWEFRRLLCPSCGEEDRDKLPVYTAKEFPHMRVEVCDSCRHYIKAVDLTVDGLAVPEVDELAAITLDLWAVEREYTKITTNLLGF